MVNFADHVRFTAEVTEDSLVSLLPPFLKVARDKEVLLIDILVRPCGGGAGTHF